MAGPRTVPLKALRDRCTSLRDHLVASGACSAERVRALEPGESENPQTGPSGIVRWLELLNQAMATDQARSAPSDAEAREQADAEALAALAASPEVVELVTPIGERRTLTIYPKSAMTLGMLASIDHLVAKLSQRRAALEASHDPEALKWVPKVDAELVRQLQGAVYVVTHEGPGWPGSVGDPLVAPDWVQSIDAVDVLRVCNAHLRVNGKRLSALQALCGPSTPGKKSPGWGVFAAGMATELGVPPRTLLHDWSLAELLSTARLSSEGRRVAQESAKKSVV